jgi:predicted TIM-barrel fold metal-dependent hydrolase
VYFDTSSTLAIVEKEYAKDLIEHFGARRFFFGVDYPMWDHEEELERFMALDLSDSEREMILYKNFERIFKVRA